MDEFENATLRQIDAIFKGYQQKEQTTWQQVRWLAQYNILPHLKKKDFNKVVRTMKFEWDQEETTEWKGDLKAVFEKWDKNPPKEK